MDCCFGILGKDFALVAADGSVAYSIMKITEQEDKIKELDGHRVLALAGEPSDRNQFGEYVAKNLALMKFKSGHDLSVKETANFIRSELAVAIRQGPYQVNAVLGGVDKDGKPDLYWLDYMGSLQRITRGAQGYSAHFLLGLLDNQWKPNMTLEEGLELAKKCAAEMRTRFLISQNVFIVKVVTKDGLQTLQI